MNESKKIQCPRCGGNGETEHTHVVYGICFMCKGSGLVYPKRVGELTERAKVRKANKAAKDELRRIEEEKADKLMWEENHRLAKIGFENSLKNTLEKAEDCPPLKASFGVYNITHIDKPFDTEIFIDYVKTYTSIIPSIEPYRQMLVNYFRSQNCFDSSLEYDVTEAYDFNKYRHVELKNTNQ